jgi:signal transduction histidine kinase
MIRSSVAVTRLLLLPYGALLLLYILAVAGGGTWLYLRLRDAQTDLMIEGLRAILGPASRRLSQPQRLTLLAQRESPPAAEVKELLATLPHLREVLVQGPELRLRISLGSGGALILSPASSAACQECNVADILRLQVQVPGPGTGPVLWTFVLDRAGISGQVEGALGHLRRDVLLLGLAGGLGILIALGITAFAVRETRRVEGHFQELYRRSSLTEMAAELVHDLRNPLMALRANVKALLITPAQTPEIVAELDRDILALRDKLSGFLDLTRSHDAPFAPADLEGLIREAVRLAGPTLAERGLEVALDLPPGLPRPVIQAPAIRDALVNLLVNAAQSGQESGAIRISARATPDGTAIGVEDRGLGIPPEALPRLFEPFFTTKVGGHGLGLPIVRRILEQHHGRATVESPREGGARLTITLPLLQPQVPSWWKAR